MSGLVGDRAGEQLGPTVAYVDTVELFMGKVPYGLSQALGRAHGKWIKPKPCVDADDRLWGYRIMLNQPSAETLRVAGEQQRLHEGKHRKIHLSRFDVAFDFPLHDSEWLERCCALKWRRRGPMHDEEHGVYWVATKAKKRTSRGAILYADKPSKVTNEPCAHLEIKFQGTPTVRNQGFNYADELIDLNPAQLFERNFVLIDFDWDGFKQKRIRKTLAFERQSHLQRQSHHPSSSNNQFIERYRAQLPRRIDAYLERLLQGRVQLLKDHHPGHVATLKRIPTQSLCLPNQISWPLKNNRKLQTGWVVG